MIDHIRTNNAHLIKFDYITNFIVKLEINVGKTRSFPRPQQHHDLKIGDNLNQLNSWNVLKSQMV